MNKPITYSEWLASQGFNAMRHANCCQISYEAGQQSRQAEIDVKDKRIAELEAEIDELKRRNNNQYNTIKGCNLETQELSDLVRKLLEDEHTYMRPSIAHECIVAIGWNP